MLALPSNELAEEVKCEDLEKVAVGINPKKFFQVGLELPPLEKEELIKFLRENADVFAWDAYETPGVDPSFICHHLNVNPSVAPKKQPPRHPSKEHANVVRDEVMKLKKMESIKEVFYPKWLANTVMVKKKSRKPLDATGHRRPRKDSFSHSRWKPPLQSNVFRLDD